MADTGHSKPELRTHPDECLLPTQSFIQNAFFGSEQRTGSAAQVHEHPVAPIARAGISR